MLRHLPLPLLRERPNISRSNAEFNRTLQLRPRVLAIAIMLFSRPS